MKPKKRYFCPDCAKFFTKKYSLTRHISLIHGSVQEGWLCPEACGYSTARRSDLLRHLNHCQRSKEAGKHQWIEDRSTMPEAYPLPDKICTPIKHQSKGSKGIEDTVSHAELQKALWELREELAVAPVTVQGASRPPELEGRSTQLSCFCSNASSKVRNLSNLQRNSVSTKQGTVQGLNFMHHSSERQNIPNDVKETRISIKEEPPASRLQLQNDPNPKNSTSPEVESTRAESPLPTPDVISEENVYEVEDILMWRTVVLGNQRRQEVLVSWLGWSDQYDTWIPEEELVHNNQSIS